MSLEVIRGGVQDTIQDTGRAGFRHLGINPSGVMDQFSFSIANLLVGNDLHEAAIELCFPASQFHFNKPARVAMAGADFGATINGHPVPIHHSILVPSGSVIKFTNPKYGSYCYLAVQGGFEVAKWLGSASTNLKANAGGLCRALKKGDHLIFKKEHSDLPMQVSKWSVPLLPKQQNLIRCMKGPEWDWLTEKSKNDFEQQPFEITSEKDRMGYQLKGEKLERKDSREMLSGAVVFGTIQLLPNGKLICLMADHQTTGGYPRVAQVAFVDLPKFAQKKSSSSVTFQIISVAEAESLTYHQHQLLQKMQLSCHFLLREF
jgi:antagonist of KipI